MSPWARASALDRAVVCPLSCSLPVAGRGAESEAVKWGNTVHAWAETGRWPTGVQYRRRQAALDGAGVSRETLWPGGDGCHEVSFALHTANKVCARFDDPDRSKREKWKADFGFDWITGTADYFDPEGCLGAPYVDDLKTGREVPNDPWDLWQLRFHAVCAALWTKAATVTVSTTHWPRYPADDPPRPRTYTTVTREDLLERVLPTLETARVAAEAALDSRGPAVAGDHCRWCPSKASCPLDAALTTGYSIPKELDNA